MAQTCCSQKGYSTVHSKRTAGGQQADSTPPLTCGNKPRKNLSTLDTGKTLLTEFDEWYADYPKKVSKQAALKAYRAARKKVDAATLIAGLARSLPAYAARDRQFIPNPATWLNGGSWDDDLGPSPSSSDADMRGIQ